MLSFYYKLWGLLSAPHIWSNAVSSHFSAEEIRFREGKGRAHDYTAWARWNLNQKSSLADSREFPLSTRPQSSHHYQNSSRRDCISGGFTLFRAIKRVLSQELKEDCPSAQTSKVCWISNPETIILRNKKTWVTIQNSKKKAWSSAYAKTDVRTQFQP